MLGTAVSFSFKSMHWGYYGEKRSDLGKQDLWANASTLSGATQIW